MSTQMDELIASAKLGGRIDLLIELRRWLDQQLTAADKENERLRKATSDELNVRTASTATH